MSERVAFDDKWMVDTGDGWIAPKILDDAIEAEKYRAFLIDMHGYSRSKCVRVRVTVEIIEPGGESDQ